MPDWLLSGGDFLERVREALVDSYAARGDEPEVKIAKGTAEIQESLAGANRALNEFGARIARIGELPAQPPTFRARISAQLVRAVQRMLFWYTPPLKLAQAASLEASRHQLDAVKDLADEIARLCKTVSRMEQEVTEERRLSATRHLDFEMQAERIRTAVSGFSQVPSWLDEYLAFEDEFRGPRADVEEFARVYLPLFKAGIHGTAATPILDLGCGRGEWLDLAARNGFHATGVDSNPSMVQLCRESGLDVACANALEHLRILPDESRSAITGFHILEHLHPVEMMKVVEESFRVLMPGGIAIFETPNPQNVSVGTHTFYLDLTHQRPLPPATLRFVLRRRGFHPVELWDLHPTTAVRVPELTETDIRFNHLFYGPQDYAAIGYKP